MKSIVGLPSCNLTSKLTGVLVPNSTARHSRIKARLGELPVIALNTPQPPTGQPARVAVVSRSSQYGAIRLFMATPGKQELVKALLLLLSCKLPLELTLAVVNEPA